MKFEASRVIGFTKDPGAGRGESRVDCKDISGCIHKNSMKASPGVSQITFSLDLSWSGDASQKLTPQEQRQRPAVGLIAS